jgi:hypothetical protein
MKPYLKDLLIIALIILCFIIGCHWKKPDVRENRTTDTVYIKGETIIKRDTITIRDSFAYPVPKIVYAAIETDSNLCDSVREYQNSLEDSNGFVVVNSTVQGKLINQDIALQVYRDSIFRVDTVKITETVSKPVFSIGATLQFDSIGYIKPALGVLYVRKKASWSGSVNSNGRVTIGGYFNLIK